MNDDINQGYAASNPNQRLDGYVPINQHVKGFLPDVKDLTVQKTAKKYLKELDADLLEKLKEKYTIDMQAFGYTFDTKNLDLGGLTA